MAELSISGKVVIVLPEQSGTGKNGVWTKQDFVIKTSEQYPKTVCFSAWGDLSDIAANLQEGEEVTVSFNPESREYSGKYYTDLRAWKIDTSFGGIKPKKETKQAKPAKTEVFGPDGSGEEDDLPF